MIRDIHPGVPYVLCLVGGPRTLNLTLYLIPKSPFLLNIHSEHFLGVSKAINEISCKYALLHMDMELPFGWAPLQLTWGTLGTCLEQKEWRLGPCPLLCVNLSAYSLRRWTTFSLSFCLSSSFFFFKERCQKPSEAAALCKYTTPEAGFRGELFISDRHYTCKRWNCESLNFQEWMFSWWAHPCS